MTDSTVVSTEFVLLPRSIPEVFAYLRDLRHLRDWAEDISASRLVTVTQGQTGAVYRCTYGPDIPLLGIQGDYRIKELEENRRIVCAFDSPVVSFIDTYDLEQGDGLTRLTITNRLNVSLLLLPVATLLAGLVERQLELNCLNLRKHFTS